MNKKYFISAGFGLALLATGCTHEVLFQEGEGTLLLNPSVSSDMKVVSRAVESELQENCMIWISNSNGLVRRYNNMSEVPAEPIPLVCGHYVAEAWTGDSVPASWEARWFKGLQEFDITKGQTTQVDLVCKIANVAASVSYAEGIEEVLSGFSMTIGHKGGELEFVGREERRGYFMMPSFDHDLKYVLTGTQIDGSPFEYTGYIVNAQPGTEYKINVGYNKTSTDVGGATFTIVIDEQEIEVGTNITLVGAPKITGYGFDINSPVMAEEGTLGRLSVYVTSAAKVTEIVLASDIFNRISALGGEDFELLGMNEVGKKAVEDAGINYKYTYDDAEDETIVQINFESEFTDLLTNGEYAITITATDANGASSTATVNILISDAPVFTTAAKNVSYFSATLTGTASKEDVSNTGFKYRRVGDTDWKTVSATLSGLEFSAEVTELVDNSKYEFMATSDNYESPVVMTFTTLSAQLPNSSFEEWSTYSDAVIPALSYSAAFWDTGNHGSKTMQKTQVTTQSSAYKHSGSSSACLKSQFVGLGIFGKFAAGNIFAGKYLKTDGTDGVLGWGRPFTFTPKSVKVWAKYVPAAAVSSKGAGDYMPVGTMDQGIIYVALVDDTKETFEGEQWPCVVKTKSSERSLFDKDGSNVIAYGEYVFEKATDGSDMIQIEIPLDYRQQGVTPSNIIFVASASRYGDYFQGGDGSLLYIDDIELIYY